MNEPTPSPGQIGWADLTIDNANEIREFYEKVVGWTSSPVPMGQYEDHCMIAGDGATVAGICHARGENVGLPPQWLLYINVEDLDACIARCNESGGKLLHGPRSAGGGRCAVIEDPAGACVALYQP